MVGGIEILFDNSESNRCDYPGTTAGIHNPYFATVISNTNPDILIIKILREPKNLYSMPKKDNTDNFHR